MKTVYISDFSKGMSITGDTFAVQVANLQETKSGKPYYRVTLVDKSGSINGQIWSDNIPNIEKNSLKPGKVVSIEATVEDYKGALQLNIQRVSGVDETALDEYIEASEFDLDELWVILEEHINSIKDKSLKTFIGKIFEDEDMKRRYKTRPAAEYVHHSFQGGLLEHVVEMLELSKAFRKFYPLVNYDLVIVGIIMHDIGKLVELDIVGTVVQRTKEGHLIGHLIKSYDMALEYGKDILDEETLINLRHIILAHHGIQEYGSPVVPATIEAAMVHATDEASTRVRIFQKVLKKHESSDEEFTEWDRILGTRVYKGPQTEIN